MIVTSASTNLVPTKDSVLAALSIKNASDTAQQIFFPAGCPFVSSLAVRAYSGSSANAAWDSGLDDLGACLQVSGIVDLQPGASHTFQHAFPVIEILGDSLPPGSYRFTVSGVSLQPSLPVEVATSVLSLQR